MIPWKGANPFRNNNLKQINNRNQWNDFGLSRTNLSDDANKTNSNVGPLRWMAPECIKSNLYSTKSDVWSFSVFH